MSRVLELHVDLSKRPIKPKIQWCASDDGIVACVILEDEQFLIKFSLSTATQVRRMEAVLSQLAELSAEYEEV